VTVPYTARPGLRAAQLADLDTLRVTLPGPVLGAIRAYRASVTVIAGRVPVAGTLTAEAASIEARRQAERAAAAARPAFTLDPAPVTAARRREEELADAGLLAAAIRDTAAAVLAETIQARMAAVTAALQARHRDLIADLVQRAKRLPPGTDDAAALETGGQVRTDYLHCRDLAAEEDQLREALRLVEHAPLSGTPDGLTACVQYEKTGELYRNHWQAPTWDLSRFGGLASLEFWLSAGREPAFQWWLPSRRELTARVREVTAEMQARRVRAARAPVPSM
jgi:hypothetical protein